MRKTIALSIVLIIAIVAMAIKYFSALSHHNNNVAKALKNIPEDSALILNFNNDRSFYEIFKDFELFDAIIGEQRAEEINLLQQALLTRPDFKEAIADKNIFISFHPNKADSVDFLYSINMNEDLEVAEIEEALSKNPEITVKKNEATGIQTIFIKSLNKPFFVFLEPGVATGSFSEEVLVRSIEKNTPKIDENFVDEISYSVTRNQNSPINIFINHNRSGGFIGQYTKNKPGSILSLITRIKGVSSLNMNYKSDALMFNGISKLDSSSPTYLGLFLKQKPVKNDLKLVMPQNLAYFISFGISDYSSFERKLHDFFNRRKELPKLQRQIRSIKEKTGVDLDKELKPYLADEFAILETESRERLAVIKVKNGREVKFTLELISEMLNDEIGLLNNSGLFYYYLGDPVKQFSRPYFSVIDNYLVLSNSPSVITNYLDNYSNGKLLINTAEFAEHNQFVANQSNIYYFINNKNAQRLISASLKNKYARAFKSDNYGLRNFYGFSYQWSSDDGHFFTNIYANYKSSGTRKFTEIWKAELNNKLINSPQTVDFDAKTIILAQDKSQTLNAISTSGQRLWTTTIDGKILGGFHSIFGSAVFNTRNELYKVDATGKVAEGFPVKLPFRASYELSVLGSNIYIPAGNVIMGFDKDGKTLPNWNHSLNGEILYDLKTATIGESHFIIAGTKSGSFYFYDEIGDLLAKTEVSSTRFENPLFLDVSDTPENSKIATIDTAGTIVYISLKGAATKKNLPDIKGPYSFAFGNVVGDDKPEYVFLNKKSLSIVSLDGQIISAIGFNSSSSKKLTLFKQNNYSSLCGVTDNATKELYLFNEDGNLQKGFPVKGDGYFLVAPINSNKTLYLIAGKENSLSVYKL